jgi:glycosyltransferase involved in cell wall biosynthesis
MTLVSSSLQGGGAERLAALLASSWAERGKEVVLLTFDHGDVHGYPLHPSVRCRSLGLLASSSHFLEGAFRNIGRIMALRRAIRESQPDVVVGFSVVVNVLTVLATRWLGTRVIVYELVDPSRHNIGLIWSTLRRLVYRLADALVCLTSSSLMQFQTMTRVRKCVIPGLFAQPAGRTKRDKSSEKRGRRVLVAMGRLVPQKGFDMLLNAFARIGDRHPEWSLTILGEGGGRDELETQIRTLKLEERVYLAGHTSDPLAVLCVSDLFVFSSRYEGFGLALCEAMACGLPVVSFDCPSGPRDIIRHGIDGILVPPEDIDALATALDRLMSDSQERERLASRAPEVLDRFSDHRILALWEQLLEEQTAQSSS